MKEFFKWIEYVFTGWWNRIFGKENELYKERMEVCNTCEHKVRITKNEYICGLCGCFLSAKTRVKEEKCDLNKWM